MKLETRNAELETAKAYSRIAFGATGDSSGYESRLQESVSITVKSVKVVTPG